MEPASLVVEYDESPAETETLKIDNGFGREEHGIISIEEVNNYKLDTVSLATEMSNSDELRDASGSHSSMGTEESISQINKDVACDLSLQRSTTSSLVAMSEKGTDDYTDKTVMEVELPELMICFKESSYYAVKDICIDEGVPSLDKFFVEIDEVGHKIVSGFQHSDADKHGGLSKVVDGSEDVEKPLTFYDHLFSEDKKIANPKNPGVSIEEVGDSADLDIGIPIEKAMPEKLHTTQESDTSNLHGSSNFNGNVVQHLSYQAKSEDDSDKVNLTTAPSVVEESSNGNSAKDNPFDNEVENRSVTNNSESSLPEISGRKEGPDNADRQQQFGKILNMYGLDDDAALDSLTGSTRSFFIQHGHGESSFSGAHSVSGPIAHSGQIPYSGSISLRSDSSTGSTHSFAFPVLNSEWNASPVRMAKADRRHFRKNRGWKVAFLCCRF